MAGWITAFKVIPWADLIVAAPTVVKGAQRLWAAVRKQDATPLAGQAQGAGQRGLEAQVEELRKELAAASELVTRLAEQNGRLVEAVDVLRVRTRLLLLASVVLAVAVAGLAILAVLG